jgi:hypothetical protein
MALNFLQRLRRAVTPEPLPPGELHSFTAEIPGASPDRPAWRLKIEMVSEAQGDGERLRIRAHLQSHLAEALATIGRGTAADPAALGRDGDDPAKASSTSTPALRLAGSGLRLALSMPGVRQLAAPLLRHNLDSWMELRASTADLVDGAAALMPETDALRRLGIELPAGDSPLAQSWAGAAPGPGRGIAQITLLRFDRRHLPVALTALLQGRPFSVAGAIVNVIEDAVLPSRRGR